MRLYIYIYIYIYIYTVYMKSLFAKTDFQKSCFLLCYHVFIVIFCVSSSFFFFFFLPSQNNPTAVWLRLIGMHNEKTWFRRIVKNGVICFCKLTLHIYPRAVSLPYMTFFLSFFQKIAFSHTMEVNGHQKYWLPTFLKKIFFCVPHKKESHVGFVTTWG